MVLSRYTANRDSIVFLVLCLLLRRSHCPGPFWYFAYKKASRILIVETPAVVSPARTVVVLLLNWYELPRLNMSLASYLVCTVLPQCCKTYPRVANVNRRGGDCHRSLFLSVGVIYAVKESEVRVDGNASFLHNSAGSSGGEKQHVLHIHVDSEITVTEDVLYNDEDNLVYYKGQG